MEPRKRRHPHTRKEWNDIRSKFTELYQVQGKKLSEVVEILSQQGFRANEYHYKTYIKKWGLDKKNKQSDMVFAYQKLRERQAKDTVFFVHGQQRTRHDVEHYWRRKQLDPVNCSPVPNTPKGLTYRTPSPSPQGNSLGAEREDEVMVDTVFLPAERQQLKLTREASVTLFTAQASSSNSFYPIAAPEPFRTQDQALHYVQVYCQSYIEHVRVLVDPKPLLVHWKLVNQFLVAAFNALGAVESGVSQVSMEVAWSDMLSLIPNLMREHLPYLMATLLQMLAHCDRSVAEQHPKSNLARMLGEMIVTAIKKVIPATHPLGFILRAASRPSSDVIGLSERLLIAGKHLIAHELGPETSEAADMLLAAISVAQISGEISGEKHAVWRYAKELYQIRASKQEADMDDQGFLNLLASQIHLSWIYWDQKNYEAAEDLLEEGLWRCQNIKSSVAQDWCRAEFLLLKGMIKQEYSDLPVAIEIASEALKLFLRSYGPGDYRTAAAGRELQRLVEKQRWESQLQEMQKLSYILEEEEEEEAEVE